MKNNSIFILVFLIFWGTYTPVHAQEKQKFGMQSLKLKNTEPEKPVSKSAETAEQKTTNNPPSYSPLTPLSAKEALIKIENLEKWNHLNEAALAYHDDDIKKLIHLIESDRGHVPPQGLFLAAKSLSDRNLMEQAAVYYFVGQLRLSFDAARWPAVHNKEDVKRRAENNQKTDDQSYPNLESAPRLDNPHQGIQNLASSIGHPIVEWAMKDPRHMAKILEKARIWDESSPYAYQPNYPVSEPVAFDRWEKLLERVRTTYFTHMATLVKAMERMKN